MAFQRVGDQLDLRLDWGPEPWNGFAPRALTRGFSALFLRPEPPGHEVFFDPEQLELFPKEGRQAERLPAVSPGAPLILGGRELREFNRSFDERG